MRRSKVGQIPKQAGCHPLQLGLWAAAVPSCPTAPQRGRICRRLIRRRQDSQGRTSQCSDADVAVVELNFLISRTPLNCQESGPHLSGFPHCPPPSHLIQLTNTTELRDVSYNRSNHSYFLFASLFKLNTAQKDNTLFQITSKPDTISAPCTRTHTPISKIMYQAATLPLYHLFLLVRSILWWSHVLQVRIDFLWWKGTGWWLSNIQLIAKCSRVPMSASAI